MDRWRRLFGSITHRLYVLPLCVLKHSWANANWHKLCWRVAKKMPTGIDHQREETAKKVGHELIL